MAASRKATNAKRRLTEVNALWNAFDPIGVSKSVDDEYWTYAGSCLRWLDEGLSAWQLTKRIEHIVRVDIGLGEFPAARVREFVKQLEAWRDGEK